MQKVSLSKLQKELLGKSLTESKNNVDLLLDDNEIIVEIEDEILAKKFYESAEKLGVNCLFEWFAPTIREIVSTD